MNGRIVWFRRIARAAACLAALVVVLGAWVRLTDAGLGCPDWPGCYGHFHPAQAARDLGQISAAYPKRNFDYAKAMHEMIHRYFATTLGLMIATLLIWALCNRAQLGQPLSPVIALFFLVCLQGTLGAFTVTMLLKPLIVTAHLLGGLTTLALLWWLSLPPEHRAPTDPEIRLRKFALFACAVLALQIALGGWTSTNYAAVACPDFPTCQGSFWPLMDFRRAFIAVGGSGVDDDGGVLPHLARVAIHFTHRIGAVVAGWVLVCLGVWSVLVGRTRRVRAAGWLVMGALATQIAIGISTVHWGFPLALATAHNAGAAFLVLSMTTLMRALWPVLRWPA